MSRIYDGQLEIDENRGVIWFHVSDPKIAEKYGSVSILRICSLPKPIPERAIDITHMYGTDWDDPKELLKSSLQTRTKKV